MTLSRRRFLAVGGGALGGLALGGLAACSDEPGSARLAAPSPTGPSTTVAATSESTPASSSGRGTRALVVVQLSGGNDPLNTLVPSDGRYRDARPGLAIPEGDLVTLRGVEDAGLHPALAPVVALWEAGHLALLDGVGWRDDPSRSHFEQLAWWWSGAPGDGDGTGWLGRWLDAAGIDDPLTAVGLGGGTPAFLARTGRATAIVDATTFRLPGASGRNALDAALRLAAAAPTEDPLEAACRRALADTIDAASRVARLGPLGADERGPSADQGEASPDTGSARGPIAAALDAAADLVVGEPATRVVHVAIGGFDTHANQAADQQRLLADLAAGLVSADQRLDAGGRADDVMVIAWSEFGRRVAENGSAGTDHGDGGLALVSGRGVKGGRYGGIDLGDLVDGDVKPTIDARSVHAIGLTWLGAQADELLGVHADTLGVV